ncbi:MAG: PQQ-binding-like beta-propeller repeat protein [bacterium]|nr:PQQ-binding-like beta-propeller repeat protein [bacterium]
MDLMRLIEKVEEYKEKHGSITRALSKLNDFYSKGEITEKQFLILKADYEKEINFLTKELDDLLTQVRNKVEELESKLKELNIDYKRTKIDILLGNKSPDAGRAELAKIAKEIALTEHEYKQYSAILEAETEEDFEKIRKMTPPTSIKVENVTPVQELFEQEEQLKKKRLEGKAQLYLKPLEEVYKRLEKIKDFLAESLPEVETVKNNLEEEAGKLVIKIRMGGPEEQNARNKLMEVIKKVKEYDELLAKISKTIEEISKKLGEKELILIENQEDVSKIGQVEEINLEEASKILEELEKQGLEVISTVPEEKFEEEEEKEEAAGGEEEKKISEEPLPEFKTVKRKKHSPVVPIFISITIVLGALFAVYRKFFFTPTPEEKVTYPVYMGNTAHNFNVNAIVSNQAPRIDWSRNLTGTPSQPAINDGVIYVGTSEGLLYALDTLGNVLWQLNLNGSINHIPVIMNNNIIVGTSNGSLYIINTTGQILKSKTFGGSIASPPIAFGEVIYVPVFQEGVYAYNVNQDKIEWKFSTEGMVKNIPLIDQTNLYIADLSGKIYIVNRNTGMETNHLNTSAPIENYLNLSENYLIYGNAAGEIGCFDVTKSTIIWSFNLAEPVAGCPAIKDSFVVVNTAFGKTYSHHIKNGIRLWNFNTHNFISSTPVIIDTFVFVSTTTETGEFGELYCLSLNNGNLIWVLPIPKVLETSPVFWGKRLFIAARDGTMYSLSF